MATNVHAEHVGSLLRPRWLLEARAASLDVIGFAVELGQFASEVGAHAPHDLQRRVEAASRHVPLADLALSPQCGFASTAGGNQLTVDDERRKLELVVGTASKIWG